MSRHRDCADASSEHVAILVLAAGASRRLGAPKQLVELDGSTLIERAVDAALASGVGNVYVVLGAQADSIARVLSEKPVACVINQEFESGMSSSIRVGLAAARREDPALAVVLIMLCDQPHVDATHLARLSSAVIDGSHPIAASAYADVLGVPAAFARSMFVELESLTGDRGAQAVIRRDETRVAAIALPLGAIDVDTTNDVASLASAAGPQANRAR